VDYLSRNSASLNEGLWQQIDAATVSAARNVLTGRRILHLTGPLGIGVNTVTIDDADAKAEVETDGFLTTAGRKLTEIPTLFEDFTLYARDLAQSEKAGAPADLSAVQAAAQAVALREDRLVFLGNEKLGYEGLFTAKGVNRQARSDWAIGENAFSDVAAAIETLVSQGIYGAFTLVVSPNLYTQLQRLQPSVGMLELDRVAKLVDGRLFKAPAGQGSGGAAVRAAGAHGSRRGAGPGGGVPGAARPEPRVPHDGNGAAAAVQKEGRRGVDQVTKTVPRASWVPVPKGTGTPACQRPRFAGTLPACSKSPRC
jgi:uncharacterized linocin/CFP29 family protein